MQYRQIGDTGIEVSTLGFGTMRFRDADNAAEIIHRGVELGINYYDIGSAYSFKSFDDNAETWTGAAIKGFDRDSMVISAKAQPRAGEAKVDRGLGISTRDDMWRCIENSLQRVGIEWFDFYQLWDMSHEDHFQAACVGDDTPLCALREAKQQGLIKHLGFTTHGKAADVTRWLQAVPDFKFITVYYNFNDRAPEEALQYAYEHGVGAAIMGPLRGGLLVGESEAFSKALPELARMPVQEIAFRFLLGSPAVTTVLSGMNEIAHLEQNAAVAGLPDPMSTQQRRRFTEAFLEFTGGQPLCSGCNYCAGSCPQGLPVSHAMAVYQLHEVFRMPSAQKMLLAARGNERADPHKCTACGACVEACPQDLPIPDRMARLAQLIDELPSEA